jgi:hypothetical protein
MPDKKPESTWIKLVKAVAKRDKITYGEAMKKASDIYNKK